MLCRKLSDLKFVTRNCEYSLPCLIVGRSVIAKGGVDVMLPLKYLGAVIGGKVNYL